MVLYQIYIFNIAVTIIYCQYLLFSIFYPFHQWTEFLCSIPWFQLIAVGKGKNNAKSLFPKNLNAFLIILIIFIDKGVKQTNSPMTSKHFKNFPQCIYGNHCFMVCVNPQCRKPGFICESGLNNREECALFHETCEKMKWSEIENIFYQNPNTKIPQFNAMQDDMELFFTNLIKKIKEEHVKFKIWARNFGYSQEMNNFITMINQGQFNKISGVYMNQILSEIFMKQEKNFETPFSKKQLQKVSREIDIAFEKIAELYNIEKKFRTQSIASTTFSTTSYVPHIDSLITQESEYIRSLFKKTPFKFTLLYRASQNGFSASKFHQSCDNIPNTMLLVKTEFDKVIGGYTPIAWNSSKKHWAADKSLQSFIFSLDMKERFSLNLAQFAVACNPQKGPIFGCCDICIVDKSNTEKSNAQFPISYNNFKYARNPQTSMAFTGSTKGRFSTKDWQIFRVDFE